MACKGSPDRTEQASESREGYLLTRINLQMQNWDSRYAEMQGEAIPARQA